MSLMPMTVKVRSAADSPLPIEVECVVDPDADIAVLPDRVLRDLGIEPIAEQAVVVAPGQREARPVAEVHMDIRGHAGRVKAAFGRAGEQPRVAPATFDAVGLRLDTATGMIHPPEQ